MAKKNPTSKRSQRKTTDPKVKKAILDKARKDAGLDEKGKVVAPPAPHLTPPDKRDRYNLRWDKSFSDLAIELWCYNHDHPKGKGGLGKEQHFRNAFHILWPDFKYTDWVDMLLSAWCHERFVTVIGHTRASKTYTLAHIIYLDWASDPMRTWASLTTVTFEGLRSRMWSDLMAAMETATVPPTGWRINSSSNELKVRMFSDDKAADKYMIEGFATSTTKDSAGRIQGKHADRRRLVLDEAQELPNAIFQAEVNAASAPDFKSFRLANPVDKASRFGMECEPQDGWDSVDAGTLMWRNKAGHLVLHFDGLQSHNIKLAEKYDGEEYEKRKYSFMFDKTYVEDVRTRLGEDSLEWWMYVRGFFPPDGLVSKAFPESTLSKMSQELIFAEPPKSFAVCDPAFESDDCVVHFGRYGVVKEGDGVGRMGVQFDGTKVLTFERGVSAEPKDYQAAKQIMEICTKLSVHPSDFAMDTTGNARGLQAILQMNWSREIQSVNFGGKPTQRPLNEGESITCEDRFAYFVDELWFRAAEWGRHGRVGGLSKLPIETHRDLAARIYSLKNGKQRLEKKEDMKRRIGRSPDYGDALVLFGEIMARKRLFPRTAQVQGQQKSYKSPWEASRDRARRAARVYSEDNAYLS